MQHVHQLQAIRSDWSTEACIGALLMNKSSDENDSARAYDLNAAVETLFNVLAIPDGLNTLATQGERLSKTLGAIDPAAVDSITDRPPPEL